MWYLCGSESLSVRCTLPAGDKHVVIVKSDHYITYQLVFLSNSQIRSFRAYSLVSQAYLLVNEPRKTNVCFAAACFSLRLITLYPTVHRICKRYLEIQNSWKMLMDIVFFIIEKTFYTCLQDDAGIGRIG